MNGSCCPTSTTSTRRGVLASAGGLGVAGLLGTPRAASAREAADRRPSRRGTSVVLLGTQGGPPPQLARAGVSSAVVVDGAAYLVDAGRRAVSQYVAARLAWADLTGVFVTHLHADHVAELFQVFRLGGFQSPGQGDTLAGSVPVFGPGPAGACRSPGAGASRRPPAPIARPRALRGSSAT